jgi:hypothetical protein
MGFSLLFSREMRFLQEENSDQNKGGWLRLGKLVLGFGVEE